MKIALISTINNPTKPPFEGGLEVQVWWLTKKLMERGHDVTLFASGDSDTDIPLVPITEQSIFKNKKFMQADGNTFNDKLNRLKRSYIVHQAYKKALKVLCEDDSFDIIHNHALHDAPLLHAHLYKAPLVTTLHTGPFREIARGVKLAAKRKHSRFVSVSKTLINQWKDYNTDADVIYNGIDLANWQYQDKAEKKTAIWFGRIVPQKAPHMAIQAARQAGYKLKLFGKIVDEVYFNEMIRPLLNPPDVDYHGIISHEDLAREIGQASVMINTPTWEEPFGLTYIEAMACGTPIATFSSGATEEIITDKTGIIVPKGDIDGLSEAIKAATKLKRADCRRHVEAHFTIDKMMDGYEDYYQKMLIK